MEYMIDEELIIDYLKKLVVLIRNFEDQLILDYNINDRFQNHLGKDLPYTGNLMLGQDEITFRFHGAGCEVVSEQYSFDYSFIPTTDNRIKITPGKFLNFIKSIDDSNSVHGISLKEIYILFNELERSEVILKMSIGLASYEIIENKLFN
jgi:hypothetical protein